MAALNYKHLHYFWVVARAGSVVKAAERLHLTPQTISGQLTLFEETLGHGLFRRTGRRLELTEAGKLALDYADNIFALGRSLQDALGAQRGKHNLPLRVGVADAVPKSLAYRLLEPAMKGDAPIQLVCREGKLVNLLADLAVQRLDIVISDTPLPPRVNIRAYNHLLGECGLAFLATPAVAEGLKGSFPACLDGAPLLIPGEDANSRPRLLRWLEDQGVQPAIAGEFDDGALMVAFGAAGAGVFVAPSAVVEDVCRQSNVVQIGATRAVTEQYYAIGVERKITHPAVLAINSAARSDLFRAGTSDASERPARAASQARRGAK
ncbi:MAG: transcriptional activator NhaR [Rhodocyclaceae bacterium]|nr:transcriptional activator NhaR [Rhodocyclaceae bacterium]MBX3667258.1 transcriptional activator NhaR [Rhodocyclaceae bacterium]